MTESPATTGNSPGHEQVRGEFATTFEMTVPKQSLLQRVFGGFTLLGRARGCLWRTYHNPSATALQRAERMVRRLQTSQRQTDPAISQVLWALLSFLVWRQSCSGDIQRACIWLHELDKCVDPEPLLRQRVELRRTVMQQLRMCSDNKQYVEEAKRFFADPAVGRDDAVAVFDIVRTCYDGISPRDCRAVIAESNSLLSQSRTLKSLRALCECPPRFENAQEASHWVSQVDLKHVRQSKTILADGLLVHVRAAEWRDAINDMEAHARKALAVAPEHLSARYWLARAQLYRADNSPAAEWSPDDWPKSPEWSRLHKLVTLYCEPSLDRAEATLPILRESDPSPDWRERQLAVRLIRAAIQIDPQWDNSSVAQCAGICQQLQFLLGTPPWTRPPIALNEICLGGQERYLAAISLLENGDVIREEYAADLACIARILAGAVRDAGTSMEEHAFAPIETAMSHVLSHIEDCPHISRTGHPNTRSLDGELETLLGNRWCRRFPHLATVVRLLRSGLGLSADFSTLTPQQLPEPPAGDVPPWIVWLHARICLTQWAAWQTDSPPVELDVNQPGVAAAVESWWSLYGRASGSPPPIVKASRQTLGVEPATPIGEASPPSRAEKEHLGPLCESLVRREAALTATLRQARKEIADGHGASATERLTRARRKLADFPKMAAIWWGPALDYYYGVAMTRCNRSRAAEVFEKQGDGPKGLEARAQMALLALERGDLDAAEAAIREIPQRCPAVLFAQALLAERREDVKQARELLQSYDTTFGEIVSPYRLASRQLLAAIEERQGNEPEAERLHCETLAEYPKDRVTSARLGKLLLRNFYEGSFTGAPDASIGPLLSAAAEADPAYRPVQFLHSLLTSPLPGIQDIGVQVAELPNSARQAFAWSQVMARRFIESHKPHKAQAVLESHDVQDAPAWHLRTRRVLQAWFLCKHVWMPDSASDRQNVEREVVRILQENEVSAIGSADEEADAPVCNAGVSPQFLAAFEALSRWFEQHNIPADNSVLRNWQYLVAQVPNLCEANDDTWDVARWERLQPWPMAAIPVLWAGHPVQRSKAADMLAASLENRNPGWYEEQQLLLNALLAWARNRDDEYLETYASLESALEDLPVREPDLWLAASMLWFQRRNWRQLLDTDLPDCVADLADPNVRTLIGLAYARAACEQSVKGDERTASRKARQASATLEELVPQSNE